MAGKGQPTLFTEERRKKILKAVSEGNYRADAAELAGIHPSTLQGWLRIGRKEKSGEHFNFFMAIVDAENSVKTRCIQGVLEAGRVDAKHYQWYLERKFPEQWGRDSYQLKEMQKAMDEIKAEMKQLYATDRRHKKS